MKRFGIGRAVIFIIVGVVFLGIFVYHKMPYWKDPIDFYNMDWDDIGSRDHVKLDIKYALGDAVSITTKRTKNGAVVSSSETSRVYFVPTFKEVDGYIYFDKFFFVEVPNADFNTFEKMTDETIEWWFKTTDAEKTGGTHYLVDGITEKMKAQESKYAMDYAKEFINELYDSEILNKNIDDCVFYDYKISVESNVSSTAMLIIGGIFVLIGGIMIIVISTVGKSREKKEAEAMAAANSAANVSYGAGTYSNGGA